jgi:hypothetical protein
MIASPGFWPPTLASTGKGEEIRVLPGGRAAGSDCGPSGPVEYSVARTARLVSACAERSGLKGRTPAQAAGFTSRQWTTADMIRLLEETKNSNFMKLTHYRRILFLDKGHSLFYELGAIRRIKCPCSLAPPLQGLLCSECGEPLAALRLCLKNGKRRSCLVSKEEGCSHNSDVGSGVLQ